MAAATFTANEDLAIPLAGSGKKRNLYNIPLRSSGQRGSGELRSGPHTSTGMEPREPAFLPRTNDRNTRTERVRTGTGDIGKKEKPQKEYQTDGTRSTEPGRSPGPHSNRQSSPRRAGEPSGTVSPFLYHHRMQDKQTKNAIAAINIPSVGFGFGAIAVRPH